jgi:hypothetical protein
MAPVVPIAQKSPSVVSRATPEKPCADGAERALARRRVARMVPASAFSFARKLNPIRHDGRQDVSLTRWITRNSKPPPVAYLSPDTKPQALPVNSVGMRANVSFI